MLTNANNRLVFLPPYKAANVHPCWRLVDEDGHTRLLHLLGELRADLKAGLDSVEGKGQSP